MKWLNFSQYVRNTGIIIGFVLVLFVGFGVQKSLADTLLYSQLEYDAHFHQGEYRFVAGSNFELGSFVVSLKRTATATSTCKLLARFYDYTTDLEVNRVVTDFDTAPVYNDLPLNIQTNVVFSRNASTTSPWYDHDFVAGHTYGIYITSVGSHYGASYEGAECETYLVRNNLEKFYKNGGDVSDVGLFVTSGTGDDVSNRSTSDLYFWLYGRAVPVISMVFPVGTTLVSNPVIIDGDIYGAYRYDIYYGNELDTVDFDLVSGYWNEDRDWSLQYSKYMPEGVNYLNIIAYSRGGLVATTSYGFSVSNFGNATSTYDQELRVRDFGAEVASSTVKGFIAGIVDVSECSFDVFSVYSLSTWGDCASALYDYTAGWFADNINSLVDKVLYTPPWGYGVRVAKVLISPWTVQTLPDLEFTMPDNMGLPASAVGRSFEFNPIESYASAKSTITDANQNTWDQVLYWWNFFCYLAFAFYLFHKVKSFSI